MGCEDRARPLALFQRQQSGRRPACQSLACTTSGFQSILGQPIASFAADMGQEGKTQGVVGPFLAFVVLVKAALAPEKGRPVDQPDRQFGVRKLARNEGGIRNPEHGVELGHDARLFDADIGAGVAGHQQADVDAVAAKCDRQSAGNVGKPPGFGEGVGFRRHKKDPHQTPLATTGVSRRSRYVRKTDGPSYLSTSHKIVFW